MIKNVVSIMDYDHTIYANEVNDGKSMTVPDQALTMSEILYKFANGEQMDEIIQADQYSEEELPDFSKMDLAEKQQYLEMYQETILTLQQEIQNETQQDNNNALPTA